MDQRCRSESIGSGFDLHMILFRRLGRAFSLRSTIVAGVIGLTLFIGSGVLAAIFAVLLTQRLGWEL